MSTSQKVRHVVALALFIAGWFVKDLQASPDVASILHIGGPALSLAGFVLAAMNQALGNWPVKPPPAAVLAFFTLSLVGCAQAVNAIGPGVIFAGCVWTTYVKEPQGTPIGQVIADEIAACGGDAASVVVVLDQHESHAQHEHVAHEVVK